MINKLITIVLFVAACGQTASVCAQSQPSFQVTEESLGKLLNMPDLSARLASRDNRHFAYIASVGGKAVVVWDGKQGPKYDSIVKHTLSFSPDSQRLVYAARRNGNLFLVLNQTEQLLTGELAPPAFNHNPLLSADGRNVACILNQNNKALVLRDGVVSQPYDRIVFAAFSPDNQRFLYTAANGQESFVVVDGVEGKHYRGLDLPQFSADSKLVVYSAQTGGGTLIVVNGQEGKLYPMFGSVTISADSKHVAYLGANAQKLSMIIVDGVESKPYENISEFKLSSDANKVAFIASHTGSSSFLVVNGIEHQAYPVIVGLTLSPNGESLAYQADKQGGDVMVLNDVESKVFKTIEHQSMVFSPDGKRLAFKVIFGSQESIVSDGVSGKKYEGVGYPAFSSDGKHLAYLGAKGNHWRMVIDNKESVTYDSVLNRESLRFDESGSLYFTAIRNNEVFRVKCTPN